MPAASSKSDKMRKLQASGTSRIRIESVNSKISEYFYYIATVAIIGIVISALGITNGYFHYFNYKDYYSSEVKVFSPFYYLGYLGIFLIIAFAPPPDYLLVPFYGYLASLSYFNVYLVFIVAVLAMMFLTAIEYFGGRFAGRPLLLKVLLHVGITERDISVADDWISNHGIASIFIATFVPYFKNVTSLAAGTLKMNSLKFFITNAVGFSLRFAILVYIGYEGINVFLPSFDVEFRSILYLIAIASSLILAYAILVKALHNQDKESSAIQG